MAQKTRGHVFLDTGTENGTRLVRGAATYWRNDVSISR